MTVIHGDSRHVLAMFPDNYFDSCVTDPPYALVSITKRLGKPGSTPIVHGTDGLYQRAARGFMGKTWDNGDVAHDPAFWAEVLRVLKPGGHVLAAAGTRTYHRLACAVEDAGFEIRDMVSWLYGSGFPKSHDVSKGIDKAAGAEREVTGTRTYAGGHVQNSSSDKLAPPIGTFVRTQDDRITTAPATPEAEQWSGWGTALKPACEPWVLARKPLEGTVAANVLKWGVGALNIDGCRVGDEVRQAAYTSLAPCHGNKLGQSGTAEARRGTQGEPQTYIGRWPANVMHDGSDEVLAEFPEAKSGKAAAGGHKRSSSLDTEMAVYGDGLRSEENAGRLYGDSGSSARFFYCAKASKSDRNSGFDGIVHVIVQAEQLGETGWANAGHKAELWVATEPSRLKVTAVSSGTDGSGWNTMLCENEQTDLFPQATTFTIGTTISSTTLSIILSCFLKCATNESMAEAYRLTASGISLVESAELSGTKTAITNAKMASLLGVDLAAYKTQLKISAKDAVSGHPTVKPTDLMRYLCRLITPPGGLILDPFAGSGSTGKAARLEGFEHVSIERDAEYIEICRRRCGE